MKEVIKLHALKIRSRVIPKGANNPNLKIVPDTIVVHYTGGSCVSAATLAECFYHNNGGYNQSCNFIVDEKEIVCSIPAGRMSYGVTGHNNHIINIEVCYKDLSGRFELETIENLRLLVKRLQERFKIPDEMVKRHYDMTGKQCPMYYALNNREWDVLHALITKGAF